jgi:iron(III) transport system substrate-binding protein
MNPSIQTSVPAYPWLSRRSFLAGSALAAAAVASGGLLAGCRGSGAGTESVTLYSSVDSEVLTPLLAEFTRATGVRVDAVGDTEATKSAGLTARIIAEAGQPRADIFWSSEALALADLAERGLLAPGVVPPADDWPATLLGRGGTWLGMGLRVRQMVFSTARVNPSELPATLEDMADRSTFKGRIGIARPAFGTTRGHMAWLLMALGPARFEKWLGGLKANDVRLLDGNAAVVRAVSTGLIDVGLTDSDDVLSGIRQSWPVAGRSLPASAEIGCLMVPNTIGLIAGRPASAGVQILLAWLTSGAAERALAASEAAAIPVADYQAKHSGGAVALPDRPELPDWRQVLLHAGPALSLCDSVLGA